VSSLNESKVRGLMTWESLSENSFAKQNQSQGLIDLGVVGQIPTRTTNPKSVSWWTL